MSLLSIYIGNSFVSTLYVNEEGYVTNFNFPYNYNTKLYGHFCDSESFYKEVIDYVIKKLHIKKTGLEIIATSYPAVPALGYDLQYFNTVDKLISSQSDYIVYVLDGYSFFSQKEHFSFDPSEDLTVTTPDHNYMSNLSIYNNARASTLAHYNYLLSRFRQMLKHEDRDSLVDRPILFLGDFIIEKFENRGKLFLTEFIRNPGIYNLKIDTTNTYLHSLLIKNYNSNIYNQLKRSTINTLGTLINSPGESSFLLKPDLENSRLLDLQENKFFITPLAETSVMNVVIKNKTLGSKDVSVSGGSLGLILDTRDKLDEAKFNDKQILDNLDQQLLVINEAGGSL